MIIIVETVHRLYRKQTGGEHLPASCCFCGVSQKIGNFTYGYFDFNT